MKYHDTRTTNKQTNKHARKYVRHKKFSLLSRFVKAVRTNVDITNVPDYTFFFFESLPYLIKFKNIHTSVFFMRGQVARWWFGISWWVKSSRQFIPTNNKQQKLTFKKKEKNFYPSHCRHAFFNNQYIYIY